MSELLTLKGTNGVSEIHIESGLLARAASVIGETLSRTRPSRRSTSNSSSSSSRCP